MFLSTALAQTALHTQQPPVDIFDDTRLVIMAISVGVALLVGLCNLLWAILSRKADRENDARVDDFRASTYDPLLKKIQDIEQISSDTKAASLIEYSADFEKNISKTNMEACRILGDVVMTIGAWDECLAATLLYPGRTRAAHRQQSPWLRRSPYSEQ